MPDPPPLGEDPEGDIEFFTAFMRSTKAQSRGSVTAAAAAGKRVFNNIGCNVCHMAPSSRRRPAR